MKRALPAAGALVVVGCSLGLDASRIHANDGDGGAPSADSGAPPVDAGEDGSPDAPLPQAGCTTDADCVAPNACVHPRCVAATKTCAYDVCPASACHAAACDIGKLTCGAEAAYGFHANAFHVDAGAVGCGGSATRCLAAVAPYLFVGTTSGVVAYAMRNPADPAPPAIPVTGLPFLPQWVVASGGRVYFVGGVAGQGATSKVPIAWIDVPSDPFATTLRATTVLTAYGQPSVSAVFPTDGTSVFLEHADPAKFFPVAKVTAPLADLAPLALFPSAGIPTNAAPVAASGERLVVYRWANESGAYTPHFSLETAAGTANAQNAGEASLFAQMGPTYPQSTFAQGDTGDVLWHTSSAIVNDAGESVLRATRLAWLLPSGTATTFDATLHVDVETYQPPAPWGTPLAGPVAWIDATTALVLAAAQGSLNQTSVQVATRTPSPAVVAGRRYVLPVSTSQVGAVVSGGFGYVLAADAPDGATVHVFAPGCAL